MQATNSKHMSFCVFFERRGKEYVEQINCLFIVCYLFVFLFETISFVCQKLVSSPTAPKGPHKSNPVTVTITITVTALVTA